jgi:hypothetical protein
MCFQSRRPRGLTDVFRRDEHVHRQVALSCKVVSFPENILKSHTDAAAHTRPQTAQIACHETAVVALPWWRGCVSSVCETRSSHFVLQETVTVTVRRAGFSVMSFGAILMREPVALPSYISSDTLLLDLTQV